MALRPADCHVAHQPEDDGCPLRSLAMVLEGVRVIDPASGVDELGEIAFADGVIVAPDSLGSEACRVRLTDTVVAPGFTDLHVHLRDPGQERKEDLRSGTAAAAAGGFATVLAMPNTVPAIDSPEAVSSLLARCPQESFVRVLQSAAFSVGREGERLTDAAALRQAGAAALTDDGSTPRDSALVLSAMRQAARIGLPVLDHCEDPGLAGDGAADDGEISRRLGVPGRPAIAEELTVARDLVLARAAQCRVHLQHLSTAAAVEMVRLAKSRGIPVTAEVTPHHLILTSAACTIYGTNAKMNPPLRTEADREALVRGLTDGSIDAIATDHAPHTAAEKAGPFSEAPAGIVGLESAVTLALTELVHKRGLGLVEVIGKFTLGPAAVLGMRRPSLAVGEPADLTLLRVHEETTVDVSSWLSRSRNCPYDGWHCRGRPVGTVVAGRWVWHDLPQVEAALGLPLRTPRCPWSVA